MHELFSIIRIKKSNLFAICVFLSSLILKKWINYEISEELRIKQLKNNICISLISFVRETQITYRFLIKNRSIILFEPTS